MDAPVLDGLDGVGDLHQLARGCFGIGVWASVGLFDHPAVPITRLAQRHRLLLLAKELARRVMDEVQPGASRAHHRRVTVFLILWRVRQQVLHFHPGAGALE
jgi:hypothetical protein